MSVVRVWLACPVLLASACFVDPGTSCNDETCGPATTATTGTATTAADTTGSSTGVVTTGSTTAGSTLMDPTTTSSTQTSDPVDTTSVDTGPDLTTTDTTTDDTTTADPTACVEVVQFTLQINQADMFGTASLVQFDGETVMWGPYDGDGVGWMFDVPCTDEWRFWVRYHDIAGASSYPFSLDDGIDMKIFDAGCATATDTMASQILDHRFPSDKSPCRGLVDPYTPVLTAGSHGLRFAFTNAEYLGSIVVTNNPMYDPG